MRGLIEFSSELPAGEHQRVRRSKEKPRGGILAVVAAFLVAGIYVNDRAAPSVALKPRTLSFATQPVGASGQSQRVRLTNSGRLPLHIQNVQPTGDQAANFTLPGPGCAGKTLAAGDHCEVVVAMRPQTEGSFSALLTFTDDAADSPQSVALNGSGVGRGVIEVSPVIYQPVQTPKDLPAPGGDAVGDDNRVPDDGLGPGIPEGAIPPVGTADPRGLIAPPVPTQPPAEKNKRLIRASVLQEALLIHRVLPVYPQFAIRTRLEGTVQLRAIIGRDGTIDSLELLSGHPILARAALDAVSQWRYRPTLLGGEPVEVETIITVVFTFQR